MLTYFVRRSLQSVLVLFIVSILVFTFAHLMPGNPFEKKVYSDLAESQFVQQAIHQYGWDQPIPIQYLHWLNGLLHGFWGVDLFGNPLAPAVVYFGRQSLFLIVPALVLALIVAVPWAIYNSTRPFGLSDNLAMFFAFIGFSIPTYWLGWVLQQVFAMQLFWLPPSQMHSPSRTGDLSDYLVHAILPITTLSIGLIATYLKHFRNYMMEVLPSEFIRTARAKGVPEYRILLKHALRNALIPIITVFAQELPAIIGGSAIVEIVFTWKGIGYWLVTSAEERHYPDILAAVIVVSLAVVILSWVADILYAVVDPRVRLTR